MSHVELIGYLGSSLVAVSILMSNIKKLRILNLIGGATFVLYGFFIRSWPVVGLNFFIVVVDIFYLIQYSRQKDAFSFFVARPDSAFLRAFLKFWEDDICRFFPAFDIETIQQPHARLILRNLNPVGVFVCEDAGEGVARILIDYVTPDYRDFKNASFLYSWSPDLLKAAGFRSFMTQTKNLHHQSYLRRLGFEEDPDQPGHFTRPV